MKNKISIFSLTLPQLENKLIEINLKKHNATQIFQWLYQKNIFDFNKMSNIAKSSISLLEDAFKINNLKTIKTLIDKSDETTKFLFELDDEEIIESVLMKFDYGYSVCVSTQVGCNMGCKFCASGLLKKVRNLSVDEIILQIVKIQNYLYQKNQHHISNIVIMGIGEPFDNYENLSNALMIMNNHYGLAIGNRHITVSTCGIIPKILQFAKDFPQVNLAISLHATNNELRSKLMPINNAYPLDKLISVLKQYLKITNRRISFEYILLKDINDHDIHIKQLGELLKGMLCYVNLIIYNQVNEHNFKPSNRYQEFINGLKHYGIIATKRLERGSEIAAACGQLRVSNLKKT